MIKILIIINIALQLPKGLLPAICKVESNFRNVDNMDDGGSPSFGICQIKLNTARMFNKKVTAADLRIPEINAYYAGRYLKYQHNRYKNHRFREYCTISAYNGGTCFGSNKKYVEKVRKAWRNYK